MVTVSHHLLRRLKELGCADLFCVPGDFVLGFCNAILESDVRYIGTCNELNASYAADGYARLRGLGGYVTTYSVGELSAINGLAGAWAEDVPVVSIVGCPPSEHFRLRTRLHHTLGDYHIPAEMHRSVVCASVVIETVAGAAEAIDRVLMAGVTQKKPMYIAICSDLLGAELPVSPSVTPLTAGPSPASDPPALREALAEVLKSLNGAKRPILIPGFRIGRDRLRSEFLTLVEKAQIPFATMLLGKSVVDEEHPLHIGLYCGDRSRSYVRTRVEESDCCVIFGERMTDFNTGGFTAVLHKTTTICVNADNVRIGYHTYHNVYMPEVIKALTDGVNKRDATTLDVRRAIDGCVHRRTRAHTASPERELRMGRFFDRIASYIPANAIVVVETGSSMFSAAEVMMPRGVSYISQAFYGSIGYTVGATLGAAIACPDRPVILFIGDGSFQVTAQDVSTMIRYKCKPTIFLLNNDGYTIERVIVDRVYNDIQMWRYKSIPWLFGGEGPAAQCKTEGELEDALKKADFTALSFLEIILDRWDCNSSLREAGYTMALNNRLIPPGSPRPPIPSDELDDRSH